MLKIAGNDVVTAEENVPSSKSSAKLTEFGFFNHYLEQVEKHLKDYQETAGVLVYEYVSTELFKSLSLNSQEEDEDVQILPPSVCEQPQELALIVENITARTQLLKDELTEQGGLLRRS